jgi:saccharopine dehydrogenase-like NADP-dependent oxidoreductase
MFKVLIAGAGKIGSLIACLFSHTGDYEVHLVDISFEGDDISRFLKTYPAIKKTVLDIKDTSKIADYIKANQIQAIVSSLPYFLNPFIARAASHAGVHYFDLTEDIKVTQEVNEIAKGHTQAFVSQCGLAPGFISIVANSLMQEFDSLSTAKLRVGALPQHTSNALQYALTWSTDGLINEYANKGLAIAEGQETEVLPLDGLEHLDFEGDLYEAFNTSGGLGRLTERYKDKIQCLNYKTLRYPGHCEKMRFLMHELKLQDNRPLLKTLLENAIPKTYQDVVVIYVSVEGVKKGVFMEKNFTKKVYPKTIYGLEWSAIQVSTASSLCAVVDMVLAHPQLYQGAVYQEDFSLQVFLSNRFSQYFA